MKTTKKETVKKKVVKLKEIKTPTEMYIVEKDEYSSVRRTYAYLVEASSKEDAEEKVSKNQFIESNCIDEEVYDFHGDEIKSTYIKTVN